MSEIWNRLIDIENHYINRFTKTGREILTDDISAPGWTSRSWSSDIYRLANIVTADVRETKRMWMMHCCVFPHM